MLHCGEPETEVGAKFHMHQAGQRSLNEYEAKAGSWGLEADFFFRFAPFENFMMKLLYEYVDE